MAQSRTHLNTTVNWKRVLDMQSITFKVRFYVPTANRPTHAGVSSCAVVSIRILSKKNLATTQQYSGKELSIIVSCQLFVPSS